MKLSTPRSNLDPIATTVKFTIDTSPPGRVQPTLPTDTQGEEGYQEHGIVVPPPLVGLPGVSEELVSTLLKERSPLHHIRALLYRGNIWCPLNSYLAVVGAVGVDDVELNLWDTIINSQMCRLLATCFPDVIFSMDRRHFMACFCLSSLPLLLPSCQRLLGRP